MLTPGGCRDRRERLWAEMVEACDLIILTDPASLIRYGNFYPSPFSFRSNEGGGILVLRRDEATIVTDNFLASQAETGCVDRSRLFVLYEGKAPAVLRRSTLVAEARSEIEQNPVGTIGVEMASIPAGLIEGLPDSVKLIDIGPIVARLRRQKDADEIAVMRRSMLAGEAAHAAALERIEPGMSEVDAFRLIQSAAVEALGEPAILYGDFVSGPRCEEGGGEPSSRIIERGDLFLLDCSVVVHGYRGDFANTFRVRSKPTDRQMELYHACIASLEAGEAQLKPGGSARSVDEAVRGAFRQRGLLENFHSHAGHGLGLGHPEPPFFVPQADDSTLMVGDVIAIEPGQFVSGVAGMRFERNYLITETGYETLSHHRLTLEQ